MSKAEILTAKTSAAEIFGYLQKHNWEWTDTTLVYRLGIKLIVAVNSRLFKFEKNLCKRSKELKFKPLSQSS